MPQFVCYEHKTHTHPRAFDWPWEGLVEMLTSVKEVDCHPCQGRECKGKDGWNWSPVVLAEGETRHNDNVELITAGVIDLDHLNTAQMLGIAERIEGYRYIIHSTHNHKPPNDQCYRLVLELSRPVLPLEWPACLRAIIATLKLPADPSCKDLSRMYFTPRAPKGNSWLSDTGEGKPLDVDALLSLPPSKLLFQGLPAPVETPPTAAVDLGALWALLRRQNGADARSKKPEIVERYTLVQRLIDKTPLAIPQADGTLQRDTTINKTASILAFRLPLHTPAVAALEILRPSIGAIGDGLQPEGLNHWLDEAQDCFKRAMDRRAKAEARRQAEIKLIRERIGGLVPSAQEAPPDPAAPVAEAPPLKLIENKDGTPKSTGANVHYALTYEDSVRGTIRYNIVSKEIDIFGGPFADVDRAVLDVSVSNWLQRNYAIFCSTAQVGEQILLVAKENAYDPLADYLTTVAWDGVPRIERALETYFRAVTVDRNGKSLLSEIRGISKKFFISCVARGLEPGCQMQSVLILKGKQGVGKSGAFDALGGPFFSDTPISFTDKDSRMQAAQTWIVELAELVAFRQSEKTIQKNFLGAREDRFRPPYARALERSPRRCVFVGTTNEEIFLTDLTGNRRYWPVEVGEIDVEGLRRDRDQIWAEAVHCFRQKEAFFFKGADAEAIEKIAEAHTDTEAQDSQINEITAWWAEKPLAQRPAYITTYKVLCEVFRVPTDKALTDPKALQKIGPVLRKMGFVPKYVQGVQGRAYFPDDRLLNLPVGKPRYLSQMANAPANLKAN